MPELEKMRKDSITFQTAQRIVALLHRYDINDPEATLQLVQKIWLSKEEREIALITCRPEL